MIKENWFCVAGIHHCEDGRLAVAWLGHDKLRDTVHLFDCIVMRRSVPVVIGERINAGSRRWLPVAWPKHAEKIAEKLLLCGCNMEPAPIDDTDRDAEAVSLAIEERMISERFKVDPSLKAWAAEYKSFQRQDNKVPTDSHPLMSATRHAMSALDVARRQPKKRGLNVNYPKLQVI